MKNPMRFAGAALSFILMLGAQVVGADAPPARESETLSPYFLVRTDDPTTDRFPLLSTRADATVVGMIADVRVEQVYANSGTKPLEAVYVFPASTRATVHEMKMTIGERTIVAEIQEREQARQTYEAAKEEGKTTSLLEQQRPNVFEMNVANVMPGDKIKVELRYTELLVPTEGVYEFVYPTVVGPRYSTIPADQASNRDRWVESPYQHEDEPPTYAFDFRVKVNAGMPIKEIACLSHQAGIEHHGLTSATVTPDASEKAEGNRDLIVRYRLAGDQIESGLLLHEGTPENFFLLTVQPPKRILPADILPREYLFIMDVSGSMNGFPLTISKQLLRDLILSLRPTDTFNVILFSGATALLSERSLPASEENLARAVGLIERQRGGGGTELLPALRRALALPTTEGAARCIVVVTDGYMAVEAEAFEVIRKNLGNANLFAFGIGESVNRFLIEGMARAGCGEPFVVTNPDQAGCQAEAFRKYIQAPVLARVQCDFGGFDAYDTQPGNLPDVMSERPVVVIGKWRGDPQGEITVSGLGGGQRYAQTLNVKGAQTTDGNVALKYLWARQRVAELSDMEGVNRGKEKAREITDLGLKYQLLTAYTSFVAVDTRVRNKDGKLTTIRQPLPLPRGVSDLAVAVGPGLGTGYGLGGFGSSGSGFNFFGIRAKSTRLAILVDASSSMVSKNRGGLANFAKVQRRVDAMIDTLDEASSFNVIAFGNQCSVFNNDLVVASEPNKKSAKEFLAALDLSDDHGLKTGNYHPRATGLGAAGGTTRLDLALTAAFEQGAETILIVSDGQVQVLKEGATAVDESDIAPLGAMGWQLEDFTRHLDLLYDRLYAPAGKNKPVIHTIEYMADAPGNDFLKKIAQLYQGRFRRAKRLN